VSYLTCLTWWRMVCVCALAAISSSLYAVDGIVLIDQNRALAGNVTPGDAPGFPVTISQSGSHRLSGSLTVADINTTAIQITADNVTLDLNGFSIIGPVVCTNHPTTCPAPGKGIGVRADADQTFGPRGVRVLNGSVRGMSQTGILMTGDGSFVERVTADGNARGGMVVAGTVIESAGSQNGAFGIFAITVRDCTSVQNLGDGIVLDGSGGVGTGNISSFNGGRGMLVPNGTATGNTVVRNNSFGISTTCPSTIVGNTIVSNGGTIETNRDGCVLFNNATR
jgi:hypothetical protein